LSGARSERIDEMNTHLTTDDLARETVPAGGGRLDSILRTLTVAVALMVFGFSAPMVFADHMGNHERAPEASTSDCGEEAAEIDSTAVYGPGAGEVFSAESEDGGVLSASEATEVAEEDETVPARPFDLRPW
jgi:hypothetical protein